MLCQLEGKSRVETQNAVLLGISLSGKNCSFHSFQWTRAERTKNGQCISTCVSRLKLLFQRQQINVRGKPSSSVCHPVTQRSSEHKPALQRYFGMCRVYMENGGEEGADCVLT